MRSILIEDGDIFIILKKRKESMVPIIRIEDVSGPLGMISKFSFEVSANKFVPKIEVDVCPEIAEEAWDGLSDALKESISKTVSSFLTFTGVKISSPSFKSPK